MPERNRKKTLACGVFQRELAVQLFHLFRGVNLPQVRENRPELFFRLIHGVFDSQPEKALVDCLIHGFMKRIIKKRKPLEVVMFVCRSDNAVPVHIRAAVRVENAEARLDRIVLRAVPDQVRGPLFFEFADFHLIKDLLRAEVARKPDGYHVRNKLPLIFVKTFVHDAQIQRPDSRKPPLCQFDCRKEPPQIQ